MAIDFGNVLGEAPAVPATGITLNLKKDDLLETIQSLKNKVH